MYHPQDVGLIRLASVPLTRPLPAWPGESATQEAQRAWITEVWAEPECADTVAHASPALAVAVAEAIQGSSAATATASTARSLARYQVRRQHRATPFGLLAGPAPLAFGADSLVEIGQDDGRTRSQVDAVWLHQLVSALEQDPQVLRQLTVVADATLIARGGRITIPCQPGEDGPDTTTLRSTPAVGATIQLARTPVRVRTLIRKLRMAHPGTPETTVVSMLARLVAHGVLLTDLRPPTTSTDTLAWVLLRLERCGVVPEVTDRLDMVRQLLRQHDQVPPRERATVRKKTSAVMRKLQPANPVAMVDWRPDATVQLPPAVALEAARAVDVMSRITPYPHGSPAWRDYRSRFLERYSMGVIVPVLELTDPETGLGFPVGYRGTVLPRPVLATSPRDEYLLTLAQDAALTGRHSITLTETDVQALSVDEAVQVPAHVELCATVLARSTRDLGQGGFTLLAAGLSQAAGTTSGRFLPLLGVTELEDWRTVLQGLPSLTQEAVRAQVCAPPLKHRTANVSRAPLTTDSAISVGEFPRPDAIDLSDLGVTADAERLYLVRLSTGQLVEPSGMNAVELSQATHPLVRFLCEVHRSHTAVPAPFAWGAAARLPFLPEIRYRRTILSPACWRAPATLLSAGDAWQTALQRWRATYTVPRLVYAGADDRQLRLDLEKLGDQDLLRHELRRHGSVVLHQAPDDTQFGWIGRAHQISLPLASDQTPSPAPGRSGAAIAAPGHVRLPGATEWAFLKLYCRPERAVELLTGPLSDLLTLLEPALDKGAEDAHWWFTRYADPEPHLRIRLRTPDTDWADTLIQAVGRWARDQLEQGTIQGLAWDTDRPETGRYGAGPTLAAAEAVFAADSAATLAELHTDVGDLRPALTAASLLDIATHLLDGHQTALNWMVATLRQHEGTAPSRPLLKLALDLTENTTPEAAPGRLGAELATAWERRARALTAYRAALRSAGMEPSAVVASLLHMHHNRVAGIDRTAEADCLRLIRTTSLSWLARARQGALR